MKELLSPKQVARAIGVSESSLKRWCDQGLIQTVRTAGGHRKLPLGDVIRFLRERKHELVCPEVLKMPCCSPQSEIGLEKGRVALAEALLAGNEQLVRQIVFDLYLAKHSIAVICDEVICKAFKEIGARWQCNPAEVYQERRSCEFVMRVLYELRRSQPDPDPTWKALGGSLENDFFRFSTAAAELVLRDAGWDATSLGVSIPSVSLVHAINQNKPRLFWMCVSCIQSPEQFVTEFKPISDACESVGAALAIGGRALTEEIRDQIKFCSYFDKMQHLEQFAKTVKRFSAALM